MTVKIVDKRRMDKLREVIDVRMGMTEVSESPTQMGWAPTADT